MITVYYGPDGDNVNDFEIEQDYKDFMRYIRTHKRNKIFNYSNFSMISRIQKGIAEGDIDYNEIEIIFYMDEDNYKTYKMDEDGSPIINTPFDPDEFVSPSIIHARSVLYKIYKKVKINEEE